jgi:hypothetical protein
MSYFAHLARALCRVVHTKFGECLFNDVGWIERKRQCSSRMLRCQMNEPPIEEIAESQIAELQNVRLLLKEARYQIGNLSEHERVQTRLSGPR